MSIKITQKEIITRISFVDEKNQGGLLTIKDGRFSTIQMPQPLPKEFTKEWFALMAEYHQLINSCEDKTPFKNETIEDSFKEAERALNWVMKV